MNPLAMLARIWQALSGPGTVKVALVLSVLAFVQPLLLESLKRPVLRIDVSTTRTGESGYYRFLKASVSSEPLFPFLASVLQGNTASNCQARLSFLNMADGRELFSFSGRWSSRPMPVVRRATKTATGEVNVEDAYNSSIAMEGRTNAIAWLATEDLDVAVKFQGDRNTYGFTNESYGNMGQQNLWRLDRYKLGEGRYWLLIDVRCEGASATKRLVLRNEGPGLEDFKLE